MQMEAAGDERLREYERGFRRAGLPLFIADRSAATDIFNRAVPLIGFVFLAEVSARSTWSGRPGQRRGRCAALWRSSWEASSSLNRSRGRPAVAIPTDVGKSELAAFVLVPALLPLIFGGQWLSAIVTAAGNLVLLGLIYAVVGPRPGLDPALDAGPPRRASCARP